MARVTALFFLFVAACTTPAPRIHVAQRHVSAGTPIVVHIEEGKRADALWLTLVTPGSPDDFAPKRILVDEHDTVAELPAPSVGTYEVRLLDPRGVRARACVEIEPSATGDAKQAAATPLWAW